MDLDRDKLVAFTDGAAIRNGKPGARASYAVVWPALRDRDSSGILNDCEIHTNNRGEFTALIRAFEIADEIDVNKEKTLVVYTDSMLLVNSLTKWLPTWQKNNYLKSDGNPVANKDLLLRLAEFKVAHELELRHVRAHQKSDDWCAIHNNAADALAAATLAALKM